MIHVLPNDNEVMASYQGRSIREDSRRPEADWVILDGNRVRMDDRDALFTERPHPYQPAPSDGPSSSARLTQPPPRVFQGVMVNRG